MNQLNNNSVVATYGGMSPGIWESNTTNNQYGYDPYKLQEQYKTRNHDNPLRAKTLRILNIENEKDRNEVGNILDSWDRVSKELGQNCMSKAIKFSKETIECRELAKEAGRFYALSSIASQAARSMRREHDIATVIDNNKVIQAISLSQMNQENSAEREINFLVTAPHNIKGKMNAENSNQVEGAGTALIEYAIVQALQKQGYQSKPFLFSAISKIAVTVESTAASQNFYAHIHFKSIGIFKRVLEGENLIRFLENYGGRALPST